MKTKKGQAAMEYLMTYGWAILAIIIVIAALIYLNPFRAPELCLFQQQGFSCSEPNPQVFYTGSGDSGDIETNFRLWNKLGKTVVVHEVICTTSQTSEIDKDDATAVDQEIPTGSYADFMNVDCVDNEGDQVELAQNQEFRGRLVIWYNYEDDLDDTIRHEAQANVISLVVQNS
jgi:uncharacterized protein (UPF0333 family)